jgi:hypothetical protein
VVGVAETSPPTGVTHFVSRSPTFAGPIRDSAHWKRVL